MLRPAVPAIRKFPVRQVRHSWGWGERRGEKKVRKKKKSIFSPCGQEKLGSTGTHVADAVEISTGNLSRLPDSNVLLQMLFISPSQKKEQKRSTSISEIKLLSNILRIATILSAAYDICIFCAQLHKNHYFLDFSADNVVCLCLVTTFIY